MKPLTHHEILTIVGPFAAAGRRVDLGASDREGRELAFQPIRHEGSAAGVPDCVETLRLSLPRPGRVHLVRIVQVSGRHGGETQGGKGGSGAPPTSSGDDGQGAQLEAQAEIWAESVEEAWRTISAFPLDEHFALDEYGAPGCGTLVAFSWALEPLPRLVRAEARIGERRVILDATRTPGMPADLRLTAHPDGDAEFPDDLVAVLGGSWRPLLSTDEGWKTTVKLPRREPGRSAVARERFLRTTEHLAGCWAGSPAEFHQRFRRARWNVFRRRTTWMQIGAVIAVILVWMFQQERIAGGGILPLWVNSVPLLLLIGAFFFWSWDVPMIEFPPIPREPGIDGWEAPRRMG